MQKLANKEVLEEVGEILKDMSKNEYMQDVYLGRKTQALFTVTPEQYKNPDYDTDNSIGLTDSSATFVPTAKVGSVIGNSTATVAPIMIRKTGQGYDNLTLGITNKMLNITPKTEQVIDITSDIVNSYLPGIPSYNYIGFGTAFFGNYIYQYPELADDTKFLIQKINSSIFNEKIDNVQNK